MSQANTSSSVITIAIDAMGGDFGPQSAIPGLARIHKEFPNVRFAIYGDEQQIYPLLNSYKSLVSVSEVIHTAKMVKNDDKPSAALRASKDTSMRLAIESVQQKQAQAVVSSGNTGALMAMAKMVLKTLPGIHRPAIASVFPTMGSSTIVLDLGANVLVDAENLVQFAVLGSAFARAHAPDRRTPSVGLLNVGTEESKGPDHVRAAAAILSKVDFSGHYHGFVEGNDITKGTVDVVVTDGYAGNIALKAAEGVGKMSAHLLKEAIKSDIFAIMGGLLAYFALKRVKNKVDPRQHNGGVFLGLNGICVKSHGGSDALAFSSAVRLAIELAQSGYVNNVVDDINHLMTQESFLAQGTYQV